MKNRGSTPILTNAVGVHPRNIHTKFEANPCSGLRGEVEKLKSSRRQQRQRRQRQRRRRRRTQPDRYSHTHSLSVTKNILLNHIYVELLTGIFYLNSMTSGNQHRDLICVSVLCHIPSL